MDDCLSIDLLDRYIAGTATRAERDIVAEWIAANPRRRLDSIVAIEPSSEARAALARILANEAAAQTSRANVRTNAQADGARASGRSRMRVEPRQWGSGSVGAAAVVAALIVIGGAWWTTRRASRSADAQWKSFSAVRGQRAVVQLADGTKIILAAESQMQVRQDENAQREVRLTGEAYFDITHKDARPFLVHTSQGTVTELGTAFVVRAYPHDSATQVMVTSGRVSLTPKERSETRAADAPNAEPSTAALVLNAGDVGRLRADGATTVAHGVDPQEYTSWLDGELRFVDTPLRTVADAVERWYDVKIAVADPKYAAYPLNVTLRAGSVDDVMELISKSLGLGYEWRGNTVWIVGRNNSRTRGK